MCILLVEGAGQAAAQRWALLLSRLLICKVSEQNGEKKSIFLLLFFFLLL